jgi:predicted nucleic acid-binding protein
MFVLDTNVVSELRKIRLGRADKNVAQWADSVDSATLYLSAITVQELEIGVLLTERRDPSQGAIFRTWFDIHVLPAFSYLVHHHVSLTQQQWAVWNLHLHGGFEGPSLISYAA